MKQEINFEDMPKLWPERAKAAKKDLAKLARAADMAYETIYYGATGKGNVTMRTMDKVERVLRKWGV